MALTPRVSVLLPVRDARATLAECLARCAGQTLADHEVDRRGRRLARRQRRAARARGRARDARVRVVRQPPRGLVAALNAALRPRARAAARAHGRGRRRAPAAAGAAGARACDAEPALAALGSRVRLIGAPGRAQPAACAPTSTWLNGLLDARRRSRATCSWSRRSCTRSVMMRAAALRALGGYRETRRARGLRPVAARRTRPAARFAKRARGAAATGATGPGASRARDPRYARATASAR